MDEQEILEFAKDYTLQKIDGNFLSNLVSEGRISTSDRRKITRLGVNLAKRNKLLTERQKLRLATKEKKKLPKLTKEDRVKKYFKDVEEEREKASANFTICLGCRKRGHFLKDCPRAKPIAIQAPNALICFNCGGTDHTLKSCPNSVDPKGKLQYATCFICKKIGHISRDCPENPNGLYPKGGSCLFCGLKTHLVKDCPNRTEEDIEQARQLRLQREQEKEDDTKGMRFVGLKANSDNLNDGVDVIDDIQDEQLNDNNEEETSDIEDDKKKRKSKLNKSVQKKKKKKKIKS